MSKNYKMEDVFEGKVITFCDGYLGDDNWDESSLAFFENIEQSKYSAHAINNHDRLVEENRRLREFVKKVSEVDIETLNFETQDGDKDYIEYIDPHISEDALELLSKLDG